MHTLIQILIMSSVVGGVLHAMLFSRLRTRHHETWIALGRPTIFVGTRLAVFRFLLSGNSCKLGDVQLIRLARFLRGYIALYVIFFFVVLAALTVSLF